MTRKPRLTKEIEAMIIGEGADLVGVAPVERFENAPKGYGPLDYMPDAHCVISFGLHLADGVCDVWGEHVEPGKTISPYLFYGYGLTNLEMGRIANLAAKRLEYKGYKSLIFPPTWTISLYRWLGSQQGELGQIGEELSADFSHRHAAVAAGLGEFGWNGLVLTPDFGPRVRFNSIITNAPLVANPMYEGPALCQPDRCNLLCTRVCPAEALPEKEREEVAIGGRRFQYSKIDGIRCQYGVLGLVKGSGCYAGVEIPPGPGKAEDMWGIMEKRNPIDRLLYENCFGIICGDFCGRCLHQCPAHIYSRTAVKPKKASA